MNTQIPDFTRYLGSALLFVNMVFLIVALPGSRAQQSQRSDEDKCHPWEYRDDKGDCVDRPHVHHFHGEHHPQEPDEQCWIECMCEEGTYPSGEDCGACSFVGTVCIRD